MWLSSTDQMRAETAGCTVSTVQEKAGVRKSPGFVGTGGSGREEGSSSQPGEMLLSEGHPGRLPLGAFLCRVASYVSRGARLFSFGN